MAVFVPLARLLGLYSIKEELEDLSFRYARPVMYERTKSILEQAYRTQVQCSDRYPTYITLCSLVVIEKYRLFPRKTCTF